jgi:methionyl-tRNA formyltransferase
MRILCCLNADVVSNVALNLLLPTLAPHEVHVALSERVGGGGPDHLEPPPRRELRVAEQLFAQDVLFPLVERAASDVGGRYLTFREIERHRGVGVSPLRNPNDAEGLAFVQRFAPDLVLSIRYGGIFKPAAIAVPRLGVLNLHAGLLPAYRGVIATFRALMAEDREIGCTLHYITDGTIDTGPVVGQARVGVDRERSLYWHVLSLYPPGIALMADALTRLAAGETLGGTTQTGGAYYSYPRADEWSEFLRRGWRVADPSDFHALMRMYLPPAQSAGLPDGLAAHA